MVVVRGEKTFSSLDPQERLVANVELDVAIRDRASSLSFGRPLLKSGAKVVALDDNGVLTEFLPDGGSRPLDAADAGADRDPKRRKDVHTLGARGQRV